MSQIGVPQKNILEPLAGGYPSTTPAAAGESALTLGQTLVDDANQETGGRDSSDLLKVPKPYRVSVGQPDLPAANTKTGTLTPNLATDANGNKISDSTEAFTTLTTGGAFDLKQLARARAIDANGLVEAATVLGAPRTMGWGAGYGAFSGGTPDGLVTATRVIQDLTYTSKLAGLSGGSISIVYANTATAGAETVVVLGQRITVGIQTTVSTATQVRAAILASAAASDLVSVAISGTGSNAQTTQSALFLTGGSGSASDGSGNSLNVRGSIAAINAAGARNHGSINVIARPGSSAPFVY